MASGAADEVVPILRRTGDEAMDALGAVAKKADDWGWKGGKPGEITGTEYVQIVRNSDQAQKGTKRVTREALNRADKKFAEQTGYGRAFKDLYFGGNGRNSAAGERFNIASEFAKMEKADIPREWTGKLSKAIRGRLDTVGTTNPQYKGLYEDWGGTLQVPPKNLVPNDFYYVISDAMRPMTNDQRTVFLGLLSDWDDSLESLAKTVRNLA
jgi:hypothetical protein